MFYLLKKKVHIIFQLKYFERSNRRAKFRLPCVKNTLKTLKIYFELPK